MAKTKDKTAKPPALVTVGVRMPLAMRDQLRAEAVTQGVSLSDIVRVHIEAEQVKPLAKPTPRKRAKLPPVSGADPQLLRHLAAIGNNVNQIAVIVNRSQADFTKAELLLALKQIERVLVALGEAHAH